MELTFSSSSLSFIAAVQVENRIAISPEVVDLLKIKQRDKIEATIRKVISK